MRLVLYTQNGPHRPVFIGFKAGTSPIKNLATSVEGGVIGRVNVLPGDYSAHDALQYAAEFGNVPMVTLNSPYHEPGLDWLETPPDQLATEIGEWILENCVDVIVSPVHLPKPPGYPLASYIIRQAALAAARETGRPVTILDGHKASDDRGRWAAASSGYPHLLMPTPDKAPYAGTTYTLRTVRVDLGRPVVTTINPGTWRATLVDPITLDTLY